MPYSSPRPSSVQWQAQTRRRSAPHSPTLRPRTTPPESVEDLSFSEGTVEPLTPAPATAPQAPDLYPTIATTLPSFKLQPQPNTQRPQTSSSPKLPVSNASAAKNRNLKDRLPTSSSSQSSEPNAQDPQSTSVFVTKAASGRKHMPKDPSRLANEVGNIVINRVEKAATNKVEKPIVNGLALPVVNDHRVERAASPAPHLSPPRGVETPVLPPQPPQPQSSQSSQSSQASRNSNDQDGHGPPTPEDLEKPMIVTSDTPGPSQTPADGRPKESGIKNLLVRILSFCNRDRPRNGQ